MDMPIPLNFNDPEVPVPYDAPNQPPTSPVQSHSPRSELLSQDSNEDPVIVLRHERHQNSHRERPRRAHQHRSSRRHRDLDFDVPPDVSPQELVQRLVNQKRQTYTLRQALHIAVERIQSDARQAAAAERERVTSETLEHLRLLDERQRAAQQESYKAVQDLRLSQLQLQAAHDKIARAEEMLRLVEHQRDDAEIAAAEARAKARQLHQERIFQAAREEGRRLGFEEGLRKGRIDQERELMLEREVEQQGTQSRPPRRPHSARVPAKLQENPLDPLSVLPSPTQSWQNFDDDHLPGTSKRTPPTLSNDETSLPGIEVRSPTPPRPTSSQNSPQSQDHSLHPSNPAPAAQPASDPLTASPAIQMYSLDIPSTSKLQQQYNLNEEYPTRTSHPWVTADQHLAMTAPQSSVAESHDTVPAPSKVTFERQISHSKKNPKPKKESWYRTLSRKFQRKRQSEPAVVSSSTVPPVAEDEVEEQVHTAARRESSKRAHPPIYVRDFGAPGQPKQRLSVDSQSISHLGIFGPPSVSMANGSERSVGGSIKPTQQFKATSSSLHAISELPASRTAPLKVEHPQRASGMPPGKVLERSVDEGSVYSNPKVVDEWRRSSASPPQQTRTRPRPPRHRPVHLTVPAPLSNAPLTQQVTSPEPSPVRIQVVSPTSYDPSESHTLGSAPETTENYLLSPLSAARVLTAARLNASQTPTPVLPNSPSSFQSSLFAANGMPPSAPTPRSQYPKSPRPPLKPLLPPEDPPRPSSRTSSTRDFGAGHSRSVSGPREQKPNSQVSHHSRTPSQPANLAPRLQSKPLPASEAEPDMHYTSTWTPTPTQSIQPLPPAGTAVSETSQKRFAAAQTPGPSQAVLLPPHDHTISRMGSNLSLRSAGSYGKYDASTYLDPAFYHAEGGGNASPAPFKTTSPLPRAHSRAGSVVSGLEYFTDPKAGG